MMEFLVWERLNKQIDFSEKKKNEEDDDDEEEE